MAGDDIITAGKIWTLANELGLRFVKGFVKEWIREGFSPDGAQACGYQLHQRRVTRVGSWEVDVKHEATSAVRSVSRASDDSSREIHTVLILMTSGGT